MTGDGKSGADALSPQAVSNAVLPPTIIRARSERQCRLPDHREVDVSDLLTDARNAGARICYYSCADPKPAPPSVVTCIRRIVELALIAFQPPVTRRIDVYVCHEPGQLTVQVTAQDRHSFARLVKADEGQRVLAEMENWSRAFSSTFSLQPVRRDRANIVMILPFDPGSRALPQSGHLRLGKPRRSRPHGRRRA